MEFEGYVGGCEPLEGNRNYAVNIVLFLKPEEVGELYKKVKEGKVVLEVK